MTPLQVFRAATRIDAGLQQAITPATVQKWELVVGERSVRRTIKLVLASQEPQLRQAYV
jgi:hypothetical protein